jgi:magnesium transporter
MAAALDSLTLAFLDAHPARAARVLERLAPADAAALFARVPGRTGGPVFAAMLTPAAARILGALDDTTALGLLTAAGAQTAVAVLRHLAEPHRTRLIEGLPTALAVASRLLLGSLEDSVGGWVDPDVIALAPDTSVAEALTRVRRGGEAEASQLWVVDGDQRLRGVVETAALLRAPDTATVATLMQAPPALLGAAMPLASAAVDPAWQAAVVLPVVERGERLLGVLRRSTLRRALAHVRRVDPGAVDATVVGLLARGYWDAVSGLVEAALTLLPAIDRVLPEER